MAESVDRLKKDCRALELRLEAKMNEFSRSHDPSSGSAAATAAALAGDPEAASAAAAQERAAIKEIEDFLQQLADATERLAAEVAERPSRADTAMVKRFREVIHDFKTTFRKQLAAIRAKREKAALYRDLREAKNAATNADAAATDTLLRERGSLVSSHRAMDEIIAQAQETREALSRQRSSLSTAMTGVSSLMGRLPGVGQLVGAIHQRRLLNDRTMAIVIAACLCFFLWWFALRKA